MIQITPTLSVPMRELKFVATTGSGPGGQHVNRVATKITLLWNLETSTSVTNSQRNRIHQKLSTRINKIGILRISSSKYRSQKANRTATIERFASLLQNALKRKIVRRKTKVTRNQKAKRMDQKKRRSSTKSLRKPPKHE
jgi:ribosome-associated protein